MPHATMDCGVWQTESIGQGLLVDEVFSSCEVGEAMYSSFIGWIVVSIGAASILAQLLSS
jgi:hypothetical protein